MAAVETESPAHAAELEAIRRVVAAVERSQRRRDPDEFLAVIHPDAVWTTIRGRVLVGFDEIEEFTRKLLASAEREGAVSYEVTHVRFVRPDVAVVKVRQRYRAPDHDREGAPLYVLSKDEAGRWLLVAGQNTVVAAG